MPTPDRLERYLHEHVPLSRHMGLRVHSATPECVEIALVSSGAAVRDSKNADGARLKFGDAGWETFLAAAKTGSFVS